MKKFLFFGGKKTSSEKVIFFDGLNIGEANNFKKMCLSQTGMKVVTSLKKKEKREIAVAIFSPYTFLYSQDLVRSVKENMAEDGKIIVASFGETHMEKIVPQKVYAKVTMKEIEDLLPSLRTIFGRKNLN